MAEGMTQIDVVDPFDFHDGHSVKRYDIGVHEVSQKIADHWFVKPHLRGATPNDPRMGTPEYTRVLRAAVERRGALYEEGLAVLAEAEAAEQEAAAARAARVSNDGSGSNATQPSGNGRRKPLAPS